MKKILFVLLLLLSLFAKSQVYQVYPQYGGEWHRLLIKTNLGIPNDTFAVPLAVRNYPHIAAIGFDLYLWDTNVDSLKWRLYSSGSGDGSGITRVGQIDSLNHVANGGQVSGTSLILQTYGNGGDTGNP